MFGQRIAQKIWLGYAIPLAVLVVAGVLVPAALSAILSRVTREYQSNARFVDQAKDMERLALDAQTHLRGYLIAMDPAYQRRFGDDSPADYKRQFRETREAYSEAHLRALQTSVHHPDLHEALTGVDSAFRRWRREIAEPQINNPRPRSGRAPLGREEFDRVRVGFQRLGLVARMRRDQREQRALQAERAQRLMTLLGPTFALLLALLIGRSISLGVTRPLLALTRATEAVERGQTATLLLEEDADTPEDEIGDLKRSFSRMARTIGQREAVLRAQNEALGALRRRVEAVLNATNEGIVMVARGGGISVVNQRFADLFALDVETLLDQTFDQAAPLLLGHFKDPGAVGDRLRALLPDPEAVADETYEIVEPEYGVLRMYSAPVRGEPAPGSEQGDLLGRIFVLRDVTRETAVDRMKTEFVSVVSHELRTPLTAIKGYVELILGGQTGEINDIQRDFLSIVQNSTGRLTALINDILDISRIESGRVDVKRVAVDYARVVRETAATLAQEAAAKNIALATELPESLPPVIGDPDRIAQALMNLLSNAIKYTPDGGRVRVCVETAPTVVTTCIEDTGIGISPADQRRLFQRFFRADNSSTREAGGTGLGLAITKAIVEKLHGTIWVESAPGEGARFYFTLPTAEASPTPPPSAPASDEVAAAGWFRSTHAAAGRPPSTGSPTK